MEDLTFEPFEYSLGVEPLILEVGSEETRHDEAEAELLDGEKILYCFRFADGETQLIVTERRVIISRFGSLKSDWHGQLSLPLRSVQDVSWHLRHHSEVRRRDDSWGVLALQFPQGRMEIHMADAAELRELVKFILHKIS